MARSSAVNSATDRSVYIVGAGVAGCAAAFTALELGYRVTVFEAGPGGPLPPALRSADLNNASEASEWWWSADYLAGRGVGGGSAVNGMVVQVPDEMDNELRWAWRTLGRSWAWPGLLGRAVIAAAGDSAKVARLSIRAKQRMTAADAWLYRHPQLKIETDTAVDPRQVRLWVESGQRVLVAAGALRSPDLVSAEPLPARDHQSKVIEFGVPTDLRFDAYEEAVTTVIVRWGDTQGLLLERAGPDPGRGALVVSAMVEGADVAGAIAAGLELLGSIGIEGTVSDRPAPVAHACCTLTGLDTIAPVVDASTLPDLPAVNPMVTVAAHARRETLRLLL